MSFPNMILGADQAIFTVSTTRRLPLGTLLYTQDGRSYRYTENGGTAIGAAGTNGGRVFQSEVPLANNINRAIANAAAVGARTVNITLGGAPSADDFAGGYLGINDSGADAAAEGHIYVIDSNTAAAAPAVLSLAPPGLMIALTTNSEGTCIKHPNKDVIIHPSPPTAAVVGVTPRPIPADNFFWGQTRGPACVLTDGVLVIATGVMPSDVVDGAVEQWVPETDTVGEVESMGPIGKTLTVNADTEHSLIWLAID